MAPGTECSFAGRVGGAEDRQPGAGEVHRRVGALPDPVRLLVPLEDTCGEPVGSPPLCWASRKILFNSKSESILI